MRKTCLLCDQPLTTERERKAGAHCTMQPRDCVERLQEMAE